LSSDGSSLGERIKAYEARETEPFMPYLPIVVRIDGRAFHTWTRGLPRPFDDRLVQLMIETTRHLVRESQALIGYTQSDEISLVLYQRSHEEQLFAGGKVQKLVSLLAAEATAFFNAFLPRYIPEKVPDKDHKADCPALHGTPFKYDICSCYFKRALAHQARFDCRAFQVPNLGEAANAIYWREQDAIRNSIQSTAQAHFSHKQLHGKGRVAQLKMLAEAGVSWESFPDSHKRGTYLRPAYGTGPEGEVIGLGVNVYAIDLLFNYTHDQRVDLLFSDPKAAVQPEASKIAVSA
jgi:tRNA(His) guanylyltransferase